MKIGRSINVAVDAHAALKTGIHGVAAGYIAKSTNIDQLIRNADVAALAAIVYAKLTLTGLIRNADIKSDAAIAISKLVNTYLPETLLTTRGDIIYRNATVPARLAKGTSGHVLTQGANDPAWATQAFGEGHILLLPHNYNSIGQGTWVLAVTAGYFLGTLHNAGSKADGDNFTFKCYMAAGTYTLRMMAVKDAGVPISDIDIEGTEVASFDWYNGTEIKNSVQDQTSIAVATAGLKTITVRIDGRNGSANDWQLSVESLAFWRTA